MRILRLSLLPVALALTAALAVGAANAAPALRATQIPFNSGPLQGFLNVADGGINCLTDQYDAQVFSTGFTGNADFTLTLKTASGAALGVYNTLGPVAPPLYQLFPAAAVPGYSCYCHFTLTGVLQASLFDQFGNFLGTTSYAGVDRTHFGFYIQGPGGLWYSQDGRNGGNAQVLTYAGTGTNSGDWWECFEAMPYAAPTSSFTGAVLVLQSVAPVPVNATTWGGLKSRYH